MELNVEESQENQVQNETEAPGSQQQGNRSANKQWF